MDPQISPTGTHIAWVSERSLYVAEVDGSNQRCLLRSVGVHQSWGLANFLAAEEFDRIRGFWWSPDGQALLIEEVDEEAVATWFISDPASPSTPPREIKYPAAGATNPQVRLWLLSLDPDSSPNQVDWDSQRWEYLVDVNWSSFGDPLVTLYDRSQRNSTIQAIDLDTAGLTPLVNATQDQWVADIPGTPCWSSSGQLITTVHSGQQETVAVDGEPVELGDGVNVRSIQSVGPQGVLLRITRRATDSALVFLGADGSLSELSGRAGFHTGMFVGGTAVLVGAEFESLETRRVIARWRPGQDAPTTIHQLSTFAQTPPVDLNHQQLRLGQRRLNTVIVWPQDHQPGSAKLPVIMNPYGGPHAQRVLEAGRSYAQAQWMANQGFAVVIADGSGSPGRGPEFEREIFGDLAKYALADQVEVIEQLDRMFPADLDTSRVGITGWSFGGYLAALAVLARPDVFHAAVAGAPVTDWRLYDSAYSERYLGDPTNQPDAYESSSLLPLAENLTRPLLIIHGTADDNVVLAHSLQLSAALTASGRPHSFLPLSNVSHMTPQEEVAENLTLLEIGFLKDNLR